MKLTYTRRRVQRLLHLAEREKVGTVTRREAHAEAGEALIIYLRETAEKQKRNRKA